MKGLGNILAVVSSIVLISALAVVVSLQTPNISIPPLPTDISAEQAWGFPGVAAQEYQYIYQQEKDTLTVTGSAIVSAGPNKVDVFLGAETEKATALSSQQENARVMQAIRGDITALGIPADDIETTSFRLSVVRDYRSQPYRIVGYRTTQLLKITSSDIDQAGEILDAAASAGANIMNSVSFSLTTDVQKEMKQQALESAARNAREKADSIASGLDVSIVKVVQASEGSVGVSPIYRGLDYGVAAESGGAAPPTEISAGDVDVSATVTVVYEIS